MSIYSLPSNATILIYSTLPCPAALHFHKALIGVGFVVRSTDWIIIIGTNPAASGEYKLEVPQAERDWRHKHVTSGEIKEEKFENESLPKIKSFLLPAVLFSHFAFAGVKLTI